LSLAEYNRLVDLANHPPPPPAPAPVSAAVGSADLRVRVDRETAQGVFTLAGDVLRAGITRVPLISAATLIEGTASDRPLPLSVEGAMHTALLPGPGPFEVRLEWGAPLVFSPGRASFTLPVPPAAAVRATIDVPGEQADVHVSSGLITSRTTAGGRTLVELTLRPGASIDVWWSMRDSAPVAAAREVRTLTEILTLLTLGDSDVRMAALVDIAVVQGEPRTFELQLPDGYELTDVSGSTVESSDPREGSVVVTVSDIAARRHQFLVTLERPHEPGSFALGTGVVSVAGTQREGGEVAIEGVGALDLTVNRGADEDASARTAAGGLHRIDIRELDAVLQSAARSPILSAFRYLRTPAMPVTLALDVKRFAESGVLAAVAGRAVATTLVTSEGRALTEITLRVQTRAQPFMKVALPPGATIVTAEVAGQAVKPVGGADGTRVPLFRPGFRPSGAYSVSFVYMHAGTPFLRKGDVQMALPRMDVPIGLVEWEVFVPHEYAARVSGGNVIDRVAIPAAMLAALDERQPVTTVEAGIVGGVTGGIVGGLESAPPPPPPPAAPSAGPVRVGGQLPGRVEETKTMAAESPAPQAPSQNVINLQRRAAGVLPVRVEVPRAGVSHQFVKPLVVDQETVVTMTYKRRKS
jgi:hypothetical protein